MASKTPARKFWFDCLPSCFSSDKDPGENRSSSPAGRNTGAPTVAKIPLNVVSDTIRALTAPTLAEPPPTAPTLAEPPPNEDTVRAAPNGDGHVLIVTDNEGSAEPIELNLWGKALVHLERSGTDRDIVKIVQDFSVGLTSDDACHKPNSVGDLAKQVKNSMEQMINKQQTEREQRKWNIRIGQRDCSLREFVDKTVAILNKFIAVGDVAASFDPVHAALPWAAVRFVLVCLTANNQLKSQIILGLAKVTSLLPQCDTYRRLYIEPCSTLRPPKDVLDPLEASIINAYAKSLLFLGFAVQQQESKIKGFSAAFRLDDAETYIDGLSESSSQLAQAADNCEKHRSYQLQAWQGELLQLMQQSHQAVQSQIELLVDIHRILVLDKLCPLKDASFDSHANNHINLCQQGTRLDPLNDIYKWAKDPKSKCIFWLRGKAGTGKSTIFRTVAQNFADTGMLSASFVFKRNEVGRDNAVRLFSTIAAQLARQRHSLAQHICDAIDADPDIPSRPLQEQFRKLIVRPLAQMTLDETTYTVKNPLMVMVVVDAIDECFNEDDVGTIIHLLPQANQLEKIRLKFFITSKPEDHICSQFDEISDVYQGLRLDEGNGDGVERDISIFLRSRLSNIRDHHNSRVSEDEKLPQGWPSQADFQSLVRLAIPLFLFAAVACRFIEDSFFSNPEEQLNKILKCEILGGDAELHNTYALVLGQLLLRQTVSGVVNRHEDEKAEILEKFRGIIGVIVILVDPLSVPSLARLLKIRQSVINKILRKLHSVLNISPNPDDPIRLFHQSFRDFLLHPGNSDHNQFRVNELDIQAELTNKCLDLLKNGSLKQDICGLKMSGKKRKDIDKPIIDKCLPSEVQYACLHWVYHLKESQVKFDEKHKAYKFLRQHFLNWLEALGLIGKISESIRLIQELQTLVHPNDVEVSHFLQDAKRFTFNCLPAIDQAPLQVYSSALIFAPRTSIIRGIFEEHISWLKQKPIVESHWNTSSQMLEGDGLWIDSLAFSADSKRIVSGGGSMMVNVWDITTGKLQFRLKGHNHPIQLVAFSSDSKLIASKSTYSTIKVWDATTGTLQHTLDDHESVPGKTAAFSPDCKLVALLVGLTTIDVCEIATGTVHHTLQGHGALVLSIEFSADGKLIASGSLDGIIDIWDAATGAIKHIFQGHSEPITLIAFSVDCKLIASGSEDQTIKIWDVAAGTIRYTIDESPNPLTSIAFSGDSMLLASGSSDGRINVWDVVTGSIRYSHKDGVSGEIDTLAFSADSKLVTFSPNKTAIKIWDVTEGTVQHTPESNNPKVLRIKFSADGRLIAAISVYVIDIWDATKGTIQCTRSHRSQIVSVAFSFDNMLVASGTVDGIITVWDAATGAPRHTLNGHRTLNPYECDYFRVEFSADNKFILLSSLFSMTKIWNAGTGTLVDVESDRSLSTTPVVNPATDTVDICRGNNRMEVPAGNETRSNSQAVRISQDNVWVRWGEQNALWLPPGYQPRAWAVHPSELTIAIACTSGKLIIVRF